MKIKDVERLLGIPKATIRFYEKEGLLSPERKENSYRDYSSEDVELLKKIIILRKIGMPVDDVKDVLGDSMLLEEALEKNMVSLKEQLQEIEGAMRVCSMMQKREESISTLDENYYWDIIRTEEEHGSRFFLIINDIVDYEKRVVLDEFGLADENGNLKVSPGRAVLIAFSFCLAGGLLWFFMDGMLIESFFDGFIFPFVCIIITSVFGLPLHFLKKKNEKAARIIKNVGLAICVLILIAVVIMMIFSEM